MSRQWAPLRRAGAAALCLHCQQLACAQGAGGAVGGGDMEGSQGDLELLESLFEGDGLSLELGAWPAAPPSLSPLPKAASSSSDASAHESGVRSPPSLRGALRRRPVACSPPLLPTNRSPLIRARGFVSPAQGTARPSARLPCKWAVRCGRSPAANSTLDSGGGSLDCTAGCRCSQREARPAARRGPSPAHPRPQRSSASAPGRPPPSRRDPQL